MSRWQTPSYMEMLSTKTKGIHRMHGFLLHIGLVVFLWHYVQRANRENFLYDLRNIDGESMQYTRYGEGQFYGWHNDAGLATQYKPVSVGNRSDGLHRTL